MRTKYEAKISINLLRQRKREQEISNFIKCTRDEEGRVLLINFFNVSHISIDLILFLGEIIYFNLKEMTHIFMEIEPNPPFEKLNVQTNFPLLHLLLCINFNK